MGKFDGYLICSDIDGTFAVDNEENRRAVRYFTDNGGRFTFATGRLVDHLRQPLLRELLNAPAALCNGGMIYDYDADRMLRQTLLPMTEEAFRRAVAAYPGPAPSVRMYHLSGEGGGSDSLPRQGDLRLPGGCAGGSLSDVCTTAAGFCRSAYLPCLARGGGV